MLKGIELFEPITHVPSKRIDQYCGTYHEDQPCCVGAHLAYELGVTRGNSEDYTRGADEWAEKMGVTRAHVILMLRMSGAGRDPFSYNDWESSPTEVYRNLCKIEEFPTLAGASFSQTGLHGADLSNTDLEGTNFYYALLTGANLRWANLKKAKLIGANLTNANLTGANLVNANLTSAFATDADLTGADLRNANLIGANLRWANLDGTNFQGANLQDARLRDTNHRESANFDGANMKGTILE